jgi:hypothetical protein
MASPLPAPATAWPTTTVGLAALLEVKRGTYLKCHGYSNDKPTCNFDISNESTLEIADTLQGIVDEGRLSPAAKGLLEDLSALVLCEQWHQFQANGKYKGWVSKLEKLRPAPAINSATKAAALPVSSGLPSPPSTPKPASKQLPLASRPETARHPTTPPSISPLPTVRRYYGTDKDGKPFQVDIPQLPPPSTPTRPTRVGPASLPTPSPEPEVRRTLGISAAPSGTSIKQENKPAVSASRSITQPTPSPTPKPALSTIVVAAPASASTPTKPSKPSLTQHTFAPYVKVRTLVKINTDIRDRLLAGLDPDDKGRAGWVYGFRFPTTHRITALPKPHSAPDSSEAVTKKPDAFVKVGYTANWERRMADIETECGYAPQVQFRVAARHYQLVEELVHLELDGARRRETVPCPGCGKRHIEWFEMDAAAARKRVEAWRDWMAREPFDGKKLKKGWEARLKLVRLGDEGEWDWFFKG